MNDYARRMIMDRRRRMRDSRRRDYRDRDYRNRDYRDYEDERDYEMDGRRDYEDGDYDYEMDGKQGVKGTGPYGIGGRYYSRSRDYEMDGHEAMKLSKKDFMKWKRKLENADGSRGEHFDMHEISKYAQQMGIRYDGYDEKDLAMTMNMLYSDYCSALKGIVPPEKEPVIYLKLAQAWLEDPDSPVEGSEKLALYYRCIVDDEE